MLLSFQRPSHLFWKGDSFPRGALPGTGIGSGPRGGPASIAPEMASEEGWRGKFRGPATLLDCRWGPCGGPKERGAASEGTRAPDYPSRNIALTGRRGHIASLGVRLQGSASMPVSRERPADERWP